MARVNNLQVVENFTLRNRTVLEQYTVRLLKSTIEKIVSSAVQVYYVLHTVYRRQLNLKWYAIIQKIQIEIK